MNKNLPKISIILVNYNHLEVTYECLKSLRKLTYPNTEIWVVDNNSLIENRLNPDLFPEIHYLQSDVNLGFAGGNNLAIKKAKGDYILLLNNDTEVSPDLIEKLLIPFNEFPDAGIVSPKILFYYENNLIQYAGTNAINPLTCRGYTNGYKEKDQGQFNFIKITDLANGACMLIKRSVIDTVGLLSESFFLYYEEYDYCEMAKRAGFSIYFTGFTYILHKESVSVGKGSPLKSYYMAKNRILFAKRNFNGWQKTVSLIYYYVLALPKNLLYDAIDGRFKNVSATLRGAFFFSR